MISASKDQDSTNRPKLTIISRHAAQQLLCTAGSLDTLEPATEIVQLKGCKHVQVQEYHVGHPGLQVVSPNVGGTSCRPG